MKHRLLAGNSRHVGGPIVPQIVGMQQAQLGPFQGPHGCRGSLTRPNGKSEIRMPKSETNPKSEGIKSNGKGRLRIHFLHSGFEFVSDFGFRFSDLYSQVAEVIV